MSLFALRRAVVLSGEIELTADDRAGLRALVNSAGVRATVVTRARIVLWRAEDRQKADAAALAGGRGRRSTCDCLGTPVMGSLGCWTGPRGAGLWDVLWKINPILRGWAAYFRYGASKKTFSYLGWYAWWRMIYWIRRKHPHLTWKQIRRRYYGTDRICEDGLTLYNPAKMRVERYRFRGAQIATPYNIDEVDPARARFRRTGHDDEAFVGRVSELIA